MRLVRLGVLIALVILLFPTDEKERARIYDRGVTAAHWTITFCDRNGATCRQLGELWSAALENAKFGAQMAYEHALNYARGDEPLFAPANSGPARGTLTPRDLQPTWRGANNRTGA